MFTKLQLIYSQFEDTLDDLQIIEEDTIQLRFNADIHNYKKQTSYEEFRQIESQTLDVKKYINLHQIELSPSYGYIEIDENYDNLKDYSFFTGQNGTKFSIEDVYVDPYTNEAKFILLIEGEPADIAIAADSMILFVQLDVKGCLTSNPFWKKSMYSGFLNFKNNNYIGSFMDLIIAFEGFLRSMTGSEAGIHRIYKDYTSKELPNYLNAYRDLRNKVMHGNENIAKYLDENDIMILVETIKNLYQNKPVLNTIENTLALNKQMELD